MSSPNVYRARMAREGRSLEQLVSLLEQFAGRNRCNHRKSRVHRSPDEIDLAVESIRYTGRVGIEETNQPMRPRMYSSPSGEQMGKVRQANVDGKTLQMFVGY